MALKKPDRTKRKLGTAKTVDRDIPAEQLLQLAEQARYIGSPYHRPPGSKFGAPKGRRFPAASKCDPKWTPEDANRALKEAIRTSAVSADARTGFPNHAWHLDGATLYEAVLSNHISGEYHAYPLNDPREWPQGFR